MRNRFDEQLALMNRELVQMGALCEEAISLAARALDEGRGEYAEKAIALASEIDQMERDIENLCLKLLLKQQPVARDLRKISAALKIITDMERIGDQAEDIADRPYPDRRRPRPGAHGAYPRDDPLGCENGDGQRGRLCI